MKFTVVGTGYVGLSIAVLLAQKYPVIALDIVAERVDALNARQSPIADADIEFFLANRPLQLRATLDSALAYAEADVIVVATPTNFDIETAAFDTSSVEAVVEEALAANPRAIIVIKSTIPIGFTEGLRQRFRTDRILFSPEFLREGKALYDNLHPSRIVVGSHGEEGKRFAEALRSCAASQNVPVLLTGSSEAEALKLFANSYLAMRVAYFNELDTFAMAKGLDSRAIVNGVCLDPRVGKFYNNPSFGFGGYCLPKDTRQLLASFEGVPQHLVGAIVASNEQRIRTIAEDILARSPGRVGIYRIVMKAGSDNFRSSSILAVVEQLRAAGVEVVLHEPALSEDSFEGMPVERDLARFKDGCDLLICNRLDPALADVLDKVYTRDLFGEN